MKLSPGKSVYKTGTKPTTGEGLSFTDGELDNAINHRVAPLLRDDKGKAAIATLLAGVASTNFATAALKTALETPVQTQDWHVGEAFADAYLTDHCECHFPWPVGRDLRNVAASPAGADLVGFQKHTGTSRFAFGEVKTSTDATYPPNVMTGRHGMIAQLEELRDGAVTKNQLMIYLGHRAPGAAWHKAFVEAATRLLADPADISLFGILVRDVAPGDMDLKNRTAALAKNCPAKSSIELRSLYFPAKSIAAFAAKVAAAPKAK